MKLNKITNGSTTTFLQVIAGDTAATPEGLRYSLTSGVIQRKEQK